MTTRRELLAASLLGTLLAPARAAEVLLPTPDSLAAALESAMQRHRALVLMVSLPGCPWCKLVRQSYLTPLRAEGQPVIELSNQDESRITDFDGAATTPARVVTRLRVQVTPTVLFVGREGKEVAQRLLGVSSVDFYGAYLQERVDAANRAVG
jgi:thioredoxin-related protein